VASARLLDSLLPLAILLTVLPSLHLPEAFGYTYHGSILREIWGIEPEKMAGHGVAEWRISNRTIMTRGLIVVVGNHDDARVEVYALPSKALMREFTVDRLEKAVVSLQNGSFFKVTTEKVASIFLICGRGVEGSPGTPGTFLTSVNGGYVAKEFIFIGTPYIYALEDSEATVYHANGSKVTNLKLSASENVVIQVANWLASSETHVGTRWRCPEFYRLSDFGASIPSAESVSLGEDLRLRAILGGEIPWTYALASVVVAAVTLLAAVLLRGRKA